MNIVEPILFQARYQPDAPALCTPGVDTVSYANLVVRMNNVARRARSLGLRRGNVVALSINNQLQHSVVILGLTQIGIIPVSVARRPPPAGLKIDAVVSTTDYPFAPEVPHLAFDFSWIMGEDAPFDPTPQAETAGDEVCRIMLTTGTTGTPKAVALTHAVAMARNARFQHLQGSRVPACARIFMNVGVGTAVGYYFLTYTLTRGGALFFAGDRIEDSLRAFGIHSIQGMVTWTGTLAHLLGICDRDPSTAFHVDTIFAAGGVFSPALLARVRPRFSSQIFTRYGATETGTTAAAPVDRIVHIEGAVGYVTPGVTVEIVDESGARLPAGEEGIVRIANDYAVDRYLDDPMESARVFRDGWFYPGDMGSLTADNLLLISGRTDDVLNAGGAKMPAARLQGVLVSFPGVSEAVAFTATSGTGVDEVWAALVCSDRIDTGELGAHCRARVPPAFVPRHFAIVDALPLNAAGKIDRRRVKQMLTDAAQS